MLNYQQNKATYTSLLFNEIILKKTNSDKLKTLNYCTSFWFHIFLMFKKNYQENIGKRLESKDTVDHQYLLIEK